MTVLECVANISEGRRTDVLDRLGESAGRFLLDVHRDPHHHRSVFTMAGPAQDLQDAARALATSAVAQLDIRSHQGAHPRFGVVDVVPFVPLGNGRHITGSELIGPAIAARDLFASWAATTLALPCYLYGPRQGGPERTLPELRRGLTRGLTPDCGPRSPHPTAGVAAVGARRMLVAYNVLLDTADLAVARRVAAEIRAPGLQALAFELGDSIQVSCNLIQPWTIGPQEAFDAIVSRLRGTGIGVARAELVGLLPEAVLRGAPRGRWAELGLGEHSTVEGRLESLGLLHSSSDEA